ncbi:hypothetical protein [Nakamurella deserti]|uniref:hypothetical protein n=1 Tax=Nakamurella deserti TaxID=2164074 RepID=UPI0013004806|nr:hypothetical protein [Nakamurella deserti]
MNTTDGGRAGGEATWTAYGDKLTVCDRDADGYSAVGVLQWIDDDHHTHRFQVIDRQRQLHDRRQEHRGPPHRLGVGLPHPRRHELTLGWLPHRRHHHLSGASMRVGDRARTDHQPAGAGAGSRGASRSH